MRLYPILIAAPLLLSLNGCCSGTTQYLCRSRQAEAKIELSSFFASAQRFKSEKGAFPKTLSESGYTPSNSKYYDVTLVSSSSTAFVAEAKGKGEATGDVWRIDEKGTPSPVTDKCH